MRSHGGVDWFCGPVVGRREVQLGGCRRLVPSRIEAVRLCGYAVGRSQRMPPACPTWLRRRPPRHVVRRVERAARHG